MPGRVFVADDDFWLCPQIQWRPGQTRHSPTNGRAGLHKKHKGSREELKVAGFYAFSQ